MWLNVFNSNAYVLTFMVITVNNSSFLYLHWKIRRAIITTYSILRQNVELTRRLHFLIHNHIL